MPSPIPRLQREARLPAVLCCCLLAALTLAGCSMFTPASQHEALGKGQASKSASATPSPTPSPKPKHCAKIAPGFACEMRNRIHAVQRYLRKSGAPGSIAIVLDDRATGAVYRNINATVAYPAASTMKLAMMTDILQRSDAGSIDLTSADRQAMFQALYTSNDDDANYLWNKYEDASFLNRIRAFGMNDARFTSSYINWGFMDCTAQDLDNLINYVLKHAPANVRNYLVYRLQHVAALDQQWGVWGAGPQNHPGNKDGWEQDGNIWITNTVGFAGPDQQYTMAIMYNLEGFRGVGDTGFKYGSNKLTQIASILFQGHHTTAPTPQASAVP
ncbi:MAG TPA: serine hydrolase [Streptosporangiaceae bacterium]|nr:serine hydrolase [Streptosporangiaceae bacterium]